MDAPYVFPKSLQVLAPAGGYPTSRDIFNAWADLRQTVSAETPLYQVADQEFRAALHTGSTVFYSSGTASLNQIFDALRRVTERRSVGIAAYTCPDVAAAAAAAGFNVQPLDIFETTLEINHSAAAPESLSSLAAVVLSNLYGLPDRIDVWRQAAQRHGFLLIDDACQSLLSRRGTLHVGTAPGTVGVVSFGRGKALHGIGGGAILWPEGSHELIGKVRSGLNSDRLRNGQEDFPIRWSGPLALAAGKWHARILGLLENPRWYRIPASVPFLGLGQTRCSLNISVKGISAAALIVAVAQLRNRTAQSERLRRTAQMWAEGLADCDLLQPMLERGYNFQGGTVPIRYPILLRDRDQRDRIYRRLAEAGLGATCSYPLELGGYPELAGKLIKTAVPGAAAVASRILTLPVHKYVLDEHVSRGIQIIKKESAC